MALLGTTVIVEAMGPIINGAPVPSPGSTILESKETKLSLVISPRYPLMPHKFTSNKYLLSVLLVRQTTENKNIDGCTLDPVV